MLQGLKICNKNLCLHLKCNRKPLNGLRIICVVHKDLSGYSVEKSLKGEVWTGIRPVAGGYCKIQVKGDGKLTIDNHTYSTVENNLLNLGDILAIKSSRLGVDWIWGERKKEMVKLIPCSACITRI